MSGNGTSRATSCMSGSSPIRTARPIAIRSSNRPATTVAMKVTPGELPFSPSGLPVRARTYAAGPRLGDGELGDLALDHGGGDHVLPHAELLRLETEREADHLGQVQHRYAEVALHERLRGGLLQVEVEVAERAGCDQAVGARVDRVRQMAARLPQRGGAVHRDDREAAALARARVLHRLAAERLDQQAEVLVALGVLVEPEPLRGTHDV